jgi:hypothetical protein
VTCTFIIHCVTHSRPLQASGGGDGGGGLLCWIDSHGCIGHVYYLYENVKTYGRQLKRGFYDSVVVVVLALSIIRSQLPTRFRSRGRSVHAVRSSRPKNKRKRCWNSAIMIVLYRTVSLQLCVCAMLACSETCIQTDAEYDQLTACCRWLTPTPVIDRKLWLCGRPDR